MARKHTSPADCSSSSIRTGVLESTKPAAASDPVGAAAANADDFFDKIRKDDARWAAQNADPAYRFAIASLYASLTRRVSQPLPVIARNAWAMPGLKRKEELQRRFMRPFRKAAVENLDRAIRELLTGLVLCGCKVGAAK